MTCPHDQDLIIIEVVGDIDIVLPLPHGNSKKKNTFVPLLPEARAKMKEASAKGHKPDYVKKSMRQQNSSPGCHPQSRQQVSDANRQRNKVDAITCLLQQMEEQIEEEKLGKTRWLQCVLRLGGDQGDFIVVCFTKESMRIGTILASSSGPYRLGSSPIYLDPKFGNHNIMLMEIVVRNVS